MLGGVAYKWWRLQVTRILSGNYSDSYTYTFLEGIGCPEGLLSPLFHNAEYLGFQQLYCFENRGSHPAIIPGLAFTRSLPYPAFYEAARIDSLDNSTSCAFQLLNVAELAPHAPPRIVPNPGSATLVLLLPAAFSHGDLRVFDATGQLVSHHAISDNDPFPLGRDLQVPGMYYYILEARTGKQRYTGRFVFE